MKQMIVMRTDLNMRKGKMVAQGAHASVFPFLLLDEGTPGWGDRQRRIVAWVNEGAMAKVCVGASSEDEIRSIEAQAKAAGVEVFPVMDAGRTEFHGVPTLTCLSLGPDTIERLDAITGALKLL